MYETPAVGLEQVINLVSVPRDVIDPERQSADVNLPSGATEQGDSKELRPVKDELPDEHTLVMYLSAPGGLHRWISVSVPKLVAVPGIHAVCVHESAFGDLQELY